MLISNVLRFIFTCPLSLALPITFHIARHTFAVLAIAKKVDIYTVSKLLGHQSITVTEIYTEVLDNSKKEAMEAIGKINV